MDSATRWVAAVEKTVGRISAFPHSGPPLAEFPESGYRQIGVRRYRIIYRVLGKCVEIALVRHDARAPFGSLAELTDPRD